MSQNSFPRLLIRGALLCSLLLSSACSLLAPEEVKPWQKGDLAKWHMVFEPDSLESRYIQHVYFSKEGIAGGYGVGGGGCGCN